MSILSIFFVGATLSDKDSRDSSNHPTSTSTPIRSRTVSEQLHQFLQRHAEQQSQQHQQQQQQLQAQSMTTSFSSVQLQHILQQRQLQPSPGPRLQRIMPRPTSTTTTSLEPSHSRMMVIAGLIDIDAQGKFTRNFNFYQGDSLVTSY